MKLEYRYLKPSEATITDTDTRTRTLKGVAIVYNRQSEVLRGMNGRQFREVIAPNSIRNMTDENVFAFWSHDSSQILGSTRSGTLKLTDTAEGIQFELDTKRFNPMQIEAARAGDVQMSFGFSNVQDEWSTDASGMRVRTITGMDVFEISPVAMPAYPDTSAALRSMDAAFSEEVAEEVVVEVEEAVEEAAETEAEDASEAKRNMESVLDRKIKLTEQSLRFATKG